MSIFGRIAELMVEGATDTEPQRKLAPITIRACASGIFMATCEQCGCYDVHRSPAEAQHLTHWIDGFVRRHEGCR